jgi:hypothetical protein
VTYSAYLSTIALKVWRLKEVENLNLFELNLDSTSDSSRRSRRGSADAGEDSLSAYQSASHLDDSFRCDDTLLESYTKIWEKFNGDSSKRTMAVSKSPNLKFSSPFCNISKISLSRDLYFVRSFE